MSTALRSILTIVVPSLFTLSGVGPPVNADEGFGWTREISGVNRGVLVVRGNARRLLINPGQMPKMGPDSAMAVHTVARHIDVRSFGLDRPRHPWFFRDADARLEKKGGPMVILGTALLAVCYLVGLMVGEGLAAAIGVKANVGGVGIAMLLLIAALHFLQQRGIYAPEMRKGVTFWAAMYIPVVVAVAATQNVIIAVRSGPIALISAVSSVLLCFLVIAVINRVIEKAHIANAAFDVANTGDEP